YILAYSIGLKHRIGAWLSRTSTERTRPDADHSRPLRDFRLDERLRADARAVADPKRTKDLRVRTDDDAVSQRRVPLCTSRPRGSAERYALIECNIIANLGGLADHYTHPMIDEHALADVRSRMNLDAGQDPPHMGYEAAGEEPAVPPQPMSKAMVN